jgi:hypothetical protein
MGWLVVWESADWEGVMGLFPMKRIPRFILSVVIMLVERIPRLLIMATDLLIGLVSCMVNRLTRGYCNALQTVALLYILFEALVSMISDRLLLLSDEILELPELLSQLIQVVDAVLRDMNIVIVCDEHPGVGVGGELIRNGRVGIDIDNFGGARLSEQNREGDILYWRPIQGTNVKLQELHLWLAIDLDTVERPCCINDRLLIGRDRTTSGRYMVLIGREVSG